MKFIPVCEPFLDGNEKIYVNDCLTTGWISSSGKYVDAFEKKFAEYSQAEYAVSVCNGTVAIHLALVAAGVKDGDEVIIPNFTMIATAFAVCYTGAMPVFVDAEKDTWNIDISKIEEKITSKTRVIMPVSIFGHPCNMNEISKLAKKYNLLVIEDAAESHGAEYQGKKIGSVADMTTFSFYANKNLTTGEGGMVVTNNEDLYKKIKYYKNLCFPVDSARNYKHDNIGFNYRLSNIHAAIGLAQVEKADQYKNMRIENARLYIKFLSNTKGITFQRTEHDVVNVHWVNGIVIDPINYGRTRDELMQYLKLNGVDTRLFFAGMNTQKSLLDYGAVCSESYPVTDLLTKNGLYLPSSTNLSEGIIKEICELIKQYSK